MSIPVTRAYLYNLWDSAKWYAMAHNMSNYIDVLEISINYHSDWMPLKNSRENEKKNVVATMYAAVVHVA